MNVFFFYLIYTLSLNVSHFRCENRIDPCYNSPCQNNGTCIQSGPASYQCSIFYHFYFYNTLSTQCFPESRKTNDREKKTSVNREFLFFLIFSDALEL